MPTSGHSRALTWYTVNYFCPVLKGAILTIRQEKGSQNPVHHRALAAIQERTREVIKGALAVPRFTAVAFQAWLGMVRALGADVEALTAGTL